MAAIGRLAIVFLVFSGWLAKVDSLKADPPAKKLAKAQAEESAGPRGVVFVVGGVGGFDVVVNAAQWALPRAGVPHEVREFAWSHGWGQLFKDLQDLRHLVAKADELAAEIRKVKVETPRRPVYLVGKSGGAGLALAAAERLPPATLERIVLLSAAVSPTYDLRPALRATKGEMVSFYSIHDYLILGWGTTRFGTIDRNFCPSAGLRGFIAPNGLNEEERALYKRLVQLPWKPHMILTGNLGNHLGTSMPGFMEKEVGPWLKP